MPRMTPAVKKKSAINKLAITLPPTYTLIITYLILFVKRFYEVFQKIFNFFFACLISSLENLSSIDLAKYEPHATLVVWFSGTEFY